MSHQDIFRTITGAHRGLTSVRTDSMSGYSTLAGALVSDIPAVYGADNVGKLAVTIAANRLLAAGAEPRCISATVTADIDTPLSVMRTVAEGMRDAAVEGEMEWGTVESTIIPDGPATGIAISAFGIGVGMAAAPTAAGCPRAGHLILLTGPAAETGAAVAATTRGIEFDPQPLPPPLLDVMRAAYSHSAGISAAISPVNGIRRAIQQLGVGADFIPGALPIDSRVAAICGIMQLDPLDLSTAGAILLTLRPDMADDVLAAVRRYKDGMHAAIIGRVK